MTRTFLAMCFLLLTATKALAGEHGYADSAAAIVLGLTTKPALTRAFIPLRGVKIVRREASGDVLATIQVPITAKAGGIVNLSLRFDTGKSILRAESLPLIDELAKALLSPEIASRKVSVNGHTDADGDEDNNRLLSLERAWAVRNHLVAKLGIEPDRLLVQGFGEELPLLPNTSEANKGLNRRVEITLAD